MNLNEVVYVGNVPKQATDFELAAFFKDVGRVIKISFMRENRNDCRTKIGFVLFENEMQALKACSFDQTIFQWNRVIVMLVNDDRHFWAGHTVIVRNISSDTNEEDLFEAFGRYGMIEAVQIPTCNFAYVGFKEKSAAVAAQRLNNTVLGKTKISVQVAQRNMRVRLEDLDSFKTPRVYNELMDAKLKYDYNQEYAAEPSTGMVGIGGTGASAATFDYDDYEDDEDNRIYDPTTNRFYDKPKDGGSRPAKEEEPVFVEDIIDDEEDDDDLLIPPPIPWTRSKDDEGVSIDLVSPQHSPISERNLFDEEDPIDESDFSTVEVRRKEITFGKSAVVSVSNSAVRVENVPREVYDEDIVRYFAKFGLLNSVEIAQSTSCLFSKIYTIIYQQQSVAEKVLQCFMRKCEFSGVVCTLFTFRPEDVIQEVPGKCVLVDYISNSTVYEDVADAFRKVGQVIYLKKTGRNTTPSVVHFRNRISMDQAGKVVNIDGDKVRVVPFGQDAFRKFTAENRKLKDASVSHTKKPLKNVRMVDIEMKEEQERNKYMILKTVYNPNYRNPDPKNLTNEVVIYNCPVRTTLKDLRRHFINIAFVTFMRWEQSPYDTNTWKVYASFGSFVDAFNAVRLKGPLLNYPIFKHMASERPKFDSLETVEVECQQDDVSVTKMYNSLVGHGAITFVDKVDHKRFLVICRDAKTAKKIIQLKVLAKTPVKALLYRDVMNQQNAQDMPVSRSPPRTRSPERKEELPRRRKDSTKDLPIPMDDLIALQRRIMDDGGDRRRPSSREDRHRRDDTNEWERDFDHGGRRSPARKNRDRKRQKSVDMDITDDQPDPVPVHQRYSPEFIHEFQAPCFDHEYNVNYHRQPEEALVYTNPPAPNMMPLGGPPRDFVQGWAPGGPMYVPPVMVPPPVTRSVFMPQPPAPGTGGILGGPLALPVPTITIHRIEPDPTIHPVPQPGDLRNYLAEKRNIRAKDSYDPTDELGHQLDDLNSNRPVSPKEMDRIENYIREKERQIQKRLHLLDKKLVDVGGPSKRASRSRERSVSPSDRQAHNRIEEIRVERVNISRQLAQLRQNGDQKSRAFTALCERQSAIDRECTDIQRQLEAKKLWLAERARSLSRERHEKELAAKPPKQKSLSRDRRSRSSSRGARRRFSRSRSRENRGRHNRYRRSRSPSPDRFRRRRSSSRDRTGRRRSRSLDRGRRYNRPSTTNIRSPESLLRDMRQLGRPREGKTDHCVFIGNIAKGVPEEQLKSTFARYGRMVMCDFSMLEKFGEVYIDYHQREDAFRALEMNRVKIAGKRLRVALNCRKPANRDGYSVIVEMSEPVPERDLYSRFFECGEIEFIWHYENATIATVTFERPESTLKALNIRELHNRIPIIVREYVESER